MFRRFPLICFPLPFILLAFCLSGAARAQNPCDGASPGDNNIYWVGLGHNSRDPMYRNPGGAVTTGTTVLLHFRTCHNDVTATRVRVWNDRTNTELLLDMSFEVTDGTYDWWQATVPASADPTIDYYSFRAVDGTAIVYYSDDDRQGGWGCAYTSQSTGYDNSYALTVYDPAFNTPDWVKNGIIYQVLPDRFRDGDPANDNTSANSFFYGAYDAIVRSNSTNWNQPICDPRGSASPSCLYKYDDNFYGGDLQGIIDKLDYLQQLGVTALNLNPVFESPSNHKVDTGDYGTIDDNLGNLTVFQTLATQAATRGIRLILDGSFVYTSSDSAYFDLYGRYSASGACENTGSTYRSWYYLPCTSMCGTSVCAGGVGYDCWYGFDPYPLLNSTNASVRDLIWQLEGGTPSTDSAITRYWLEQGASGWRLDTPEEIDPGPTGNTGNNYWEGFRTAAQAEKTDAYITGDVWGYATPLLLGGELDAAVNYPLSTAILGFWRDQSLRDNDHNTSSPLGEISPLSPSQFDLRFHNLEERYPPPAFQAMTNLLDNHDTSRALFLLDENADSYTQATFWNAAYDWSDAVTRLKGAVLLQMTLPGAPTIYYGDEVGLVGPPVYDGSTWQDNPYNRIPFPWLDQAGLPYYTRLHSQANQDDIRNYYIKLTGARNAHPALRTGSFRTLLTDDANSIYAYGRVMADYSDAAVVLVNRKNSVQSIAADVAGYLPVGAQFREVLTNGDYTVDPTGKLTVPGVAARSGALLVSTGGLSLPPPAPANLTKTECVTQIELAWDAVSGADRYDVYRSILPGGGYQLLGNTTGTTYSDGGVSSGKTYHYAAVSANDTTLLRSGYSGEVPASLRPAVGSGSVHWPATITHTIGLTPTENIYGWVLVDGVTSLSGQGAGVRGQVGYGTGPDPSTWQWREASYHADAGTSDEYAGTLLPESVGTFSYLYRFTTSNTCEWTYCDRNGIGTSAPGTLTVNASADTAAPSIPADLTITAVTAGYIDLAWDASTDNVAVYAYDLFRSTDGSSPGTFLARVPAPALAYRDAALVDGSTYSYVVQAVDTSFNRSAGYSNQVTEQVTEVTGASWNASGTALSWDYPPRATSYKIYRGTPENLPHLVDGSTDSCTRWTGTGRSATLDEVPAASDFYWYLVVGVNRAGDGSAGNASGGARIVNSSGGCP